MSAIDVPDIRVAAVPAGPLPDLLAQPLLRPLAGPALEVVAADAALQQRTRDAGMEVAAQEVEALPALPQVDHPRLVGMQRKPQPGQDAPAAASAASAWPRVRHSTTKSSA